MLIEGALPFTAMTVVVLLDELVERSDWPLVEVRVALVEVGVWLPNCVGLRLLTAQAPWL